MIRSLTAKSKSCFRSKVTRSYELFFSLDSCFASHSSSMERSDARDLDAPPVSPILLQRPEYPLLRFSGLEGQALPGLFELINQLGERGLLRLCIYFVQVGGPVFESAFGELAVAGLKGVLFALADDFFHRILSAVH